MIDDTYQAAIKDAAAIVAEPKAAAQTLPERIDAIVWPDPVDLRALAAYKPEPPKMIIDAWLPAGYATLIAGHGGVGKSHAVALRLAVSAALGLDFYGFPCAQRRVLYLSCEDRESVLHWRLQHTCDYLGIDIADLADRLHILDLVGRDTVLWQRDPRDGFTLTPGYGHLRQAIEQAEAEIIVVDGISDTFAGNENARNEVKQFINALVALIPLTGAVLLVGHVAKSATSGTFSEGYSGSTGWHNSVRARWYLRPEIERTDEGTAATGDLILELQKSNLGRPDQSIRLRWDESAHVFTGEAVGKLSHFDQRQRDQDEQDGIMAALRAVVASGDYCPAAMQGQRTAYHVLSVRPELPESLRGKANTRRFRRHIEVLRQIRRIVTGSIRRKNRTYAETLEPAEPENTGVAPNAPNTNAENREHSGAVRKCTNAPHSAGGIRGGVRAHTGEDYRAAKGGK